MIRVSIQSKNYSPIQKELQTLLQSQDIEHRIETYEKHQHADIYIIEIENIDDIKHIQNLNRYEDTLCYVIGPQDYTLVSECIKENVNLYLSKDHMIEDIKNNTSKIIEDIQERFQFYTYQRHGLKSQIRLSQIYYVESLRHQIIIHSINGTFVERKNLSLFLQDIQSLHFIQIHKSFVVNKRWIKDLKGQEVILKNAERLPIGRAYKMQFNQR